MRNKRMWKLVSQGFDLLVAARLEQKSHPVIMQSTGDEEEEEDLITFSEDEDAENGEMIRLFGGADDEAQDERETGEGAGETKDHEERMIGENEADEDDSGDNLPSAPTLTKAQLKERLALMQPINAAPPVKVSKSEKLKAKISSRQQQRLSENAHVLKLILGKTSIYCSSDIMIDKVLAFITKLVKAHPGMQLRGRIKDRSRIDYDPTAMNVTGIASRLRFIIAEGNTPRDVELMLRPFVVWNKQCFPKLEPNLRDLAVHYNQSGKSAYRSCWLHHQRTHRSLRPIKYAKREDVVKAVVASQREHCKKVHTASLLLLSPAMLQKWALRGTITQDERKHANTWSLYDEGAGFGEKVAECFSLEGRTSEVYEDMVERCLFAFKLANKSSVFGSQP